MKLTKILLILMAVLVLLIVAGCSNQPASIEGTGTTGGPGQDNLPPGGTTPNTTIINTTQEGVAISPGTLPIETATQIGIQYVLDIFGQNVEGMFIDMEYADWEHVTRTLWFGAVSNTYRNTIANRAAMSALNEEVMARHEAGEEWEDIFEDMGDRFRNYSYTHAIYYFFLDAVTGERIDIWQTTPEQIRLSMVESIPLHEYIEQRWGSDWTAAFEADVDPQEEAALAQIAMEYAQRHFNNQTVTGVNLESAFSSFYYNGGGFDRIPYAVFVATSNAGREARISIRIQSQTVLSINTMSNDFVPMEFDDFITEREYRREDGDGSQDGGTVPPERERR